MGINGRPSSSSSRGTKVRSRERISDGAQSKKSILKLNSKQVSAENGNVLSSSSASSDSQDVNNKRKNPDEDSANSDSDSHLDPATKRLAIAKEYLKKLVGDSDDEFGKEFGGLNGDRSQQDSDKSDDDEEEFGKSGLARARSEMVKKAALLESGRATIHVAEKVRADSASHSVQLKRGHRLPATCIALSRDELTAITGSKDKSLTIWNVETVQRVQTLNGVHSKAGSSGKGHANVVLSVAMCEDSSLFVSGGLDRVIRIWDSRIPEPSSQVAVLRGHRGSVSGITFRGSSSEIVSASDDRTLKLWDVRTHAYIDTLYGHAAEVNCVHSVTGARAVSGGRDGTLRMWKIADDSQLVFRSSAIAVDCVSMMSETKFVSGDDNGTVSLWHVSRKKPVHSIERAHGGESNSALWISSVSAARYSDLVASGSSDGFLRIWGIDQESSQLNQVTQLQVPGYVNASAFGHSNRIVACATGQEHRLGRWNKIAKSVNGLFVARLSLSDN
mmetsp:Transcript_9107/g.16386  ORF Transcript_9107/g.16386 Transcript_9107/m.16386 type:complete len:502 (-) Transcript_9107:694-2199(-)|eukprot:CAMPEP_0182443690 /NCGR_PEP_ID=MMETSP1172-20130603/2359_1 /TAXON_ID=708627 /ORGANISM="Timspurckia oligopyrenoides, Strain CCMP3278" /LENGTH=501 /DNA_ID=CAMNT_0024639045 /DNA_START=8 /DNA_END=1513 /DNA_ORIENTATION=-